MKTPTLLLIPLLYLSCFNSKQPSTTDHQSSPAVDTTIPQPSPAEKDSSYIDYWCSTEILRKTAENMDQLDLVMIANFLATFHESCNNNVEYSEWSNELLFKVIRQRPDRFLELITKNSSLSRDYILNELTSPVHEQTDWDNTINNIEKLDIPDSAPWKLRVIQALETAKGK